MIACAHLELKLARKSLRGNDALGNLQLRKIRGEGRKEAARPGRYHSRSVVCICSVGQKVICVVERDKTFRMPSRDEDARRVVNTDHLIKW